MISVLLERIAKLGAGWVENVPEWGKVCIPEAYYKRVIVVHHL